MKKDQNTHCAWCSKRLVLVSLANTWHCSQKCHDLHHAAYEKLEMDEILANFASEKRELLSTIEDLRKEIIEITRQKNSSRVSANKQQKPTTTKEIAALYTTIQSLPQERDKEEKPWTIKNSELKARIKELEERIKETGDGSAD